MIELTLTRQDDFPSKPIKLANNKTQTATYYPMRYFLTAKKQTAGFTLLELMIVVVIIGLLAAYVGPKYFAQLGKSEVAVAQAQIEAFEKALDTLRLEVGRYPTTEEGLNTLLIQPASMNKWNGPYLKKQVPLDPWGNSYTYRSPGQDKEFEIGSLGKDGQIGGIGEAADITN